MINLAKKFIAITTLAISLTNVAQSQSMVYEDEFCEENSPYLRSICLPQEDEPLICLPQEKPQPSSSILGSIWESITIGVCSGGATYVIHTHKLPLATGIYASLYGIYTYWNDVKTAIYTRTIADVAYSMSHWVYVHSGYALITYMSCCITHNTIHRTRCSCSSS